MVALLLLLVVADRLKSEELSRVRAGAISGIRLGSQGLIWAIGSVHECRNGLHDVRHIGGFLYIV
jgi:hypothetical protein